MRGSHGNVGDPSVGQVAVLTQTPRCVGSGHLLFIAAPTVSATGLPGVVGPGAGPGTGAGDHMTSIPITAMYIHRLTGVVTRTIANRYAGKLICE